MRAEYCFVPLNTDSSFTDIGSTRSCHSQRLDERIFGKKYHVVVRPRCYSPNEPLIKQKKLKSTKIFSRCLSVCCCLWIFIANTKSNFLVRGAKRRDQLFKTKAAFTVTVEVRKFFVQDDPHVSRYNMLRASIRRVGVFCLDAPVCPSLKKTTFRAHRQCILMRTEAVWYGLNLRRPWSPTAFPGSELTNETSQIRNCYEDLGSDRKWSEARASTSQVGKFI